jgi:hypothetical protein
MSTLWHALLSTSASHRLADVSCFDQHFRVVPIAVVSSRSKLRRLYSTIWSARAAPQGRRSRVSIALSRAQQGGLGVGLGLSGHAAACCGFAAVGLAASAASLIAAITKLVTV